MDNKIQELPPFSKFVTEMLIFRNSRSQIFSKIDAYEKFAIFTEALRLQNTCGGYFWISAAANTFFQLNLVFIADSRTGVCSKS